MTLKRKKQAIYFKVNPSFRVLKMSSIPLCLAAHLRNACSSNTKSVFILVCSSPRSSNAASGLLHQLVQTNNTVLHHLFYFFTLEVKLLWPVAVRF